MKKLITAVLTATLVLGSASAAFAQGRYSHRSHGHHHHHHGHGFRHNPAPYIAGALGLAIVGSILYDQYGRRCWTQQIDVDPYGRPVYGRVCE
jgi:hypothetical protein